MSFSAGLGSLFGAFGGKITERDAIMQAQPRSADVVLAFRPKAKSKPAKKRQRRAKRERKNPPR